MSLIAEMNRDLQNGQQDNNDRELPLFAAADAIHRRRRHRLALFLGLPILIVPAGWLAIVLLAAPGHHDSAGPMVAAARVRTGSITVGVNESDSDSDSHEVATTRNPGPDIALVTVAANNKQPPAKTPMARAGRPATSPVTAVIKNPAGAAGTEGQPGRAQQKQEPVVAAENPAIEPEQEKSIEVPAKILLDRTGSESATVVSSGNPGIVKAIRSESDADFDAGLTARARQVLRESGTIAAQRVLQGYFERGDKVAQNLPQSAAFYSTLLIEGGALQPAGQLLSVQLGLHPDAVGLQQAQLRLLLAQGRFSDAVTWVNNLPGNIQQQPQVMEFYAIALQSSGKFELAGYVYRQLLEKNINNARWWMGLAVALDSNAQAIDARYAYQKVLGFRTLGVELNNYAQQRIAQL